VKNRLLPVFWLLLGLFGAMVLGLEFHWRSTHDLVKDPAPAPDGSVVAEVRALDTNRPGPSGVYLRGRWAWLRSLEPHLVFTGECDQLDARWFGPRRLVIECELRSGQPQLLQNVFDGVVIEVVVVRRFADRSTGGMPG
jgi:hypothetical protein